MEAFLISLSTDHSWLVYVLIVVLACAEGPILSLIFGALIKLNYFELLPIYAALMIGDLIGDVIWYEIGKHFAHGFIRRFGKYFSVTENEVGKVTRIFHKYKHRILIISKVSNGFGFALVTLITAGIVRIPFFRYMSINLIGQFVWTGMLLAVGYYFSNWYTQVDSVLGKVSIIALFVLLFAAFLGYRKYVRAKAESLIKD
ncbi:MAG TPA: VTT domain-containing protein [Candidatus Paceibacterota bacterium]